MDSIDVQNALKIVRALDTERNKLRSEYYAAKQRYQRFQEQYRSLLGGETETLPIVIEGEKGGKRGNVTLA